MNLILSYISFFLAITIAFSSCEKAFNLDSSAQKKVVVNSILEINDTIRVQLSLSRNILVKGDSIDWIRNADVYLKCGTNNFQEKLSYSKNGVYKSKHLGQYSEAYELEVLYDEQRILAYAVMPSETKGTVKYKEFDNETEIQSYLELEIPERDDEKYYIWEMYGEDNSNVTITSLDKKTETILPDQTQSRDKIFLPGSINEIGAPYSTSFIAEDNNETNILKSTVRLLTVNKDMYEYLKSLELYKNSGNNYLEPIEIYSNIENGIGIFGAYTESVIQVSQ